MRRFFRHEALCKCRILSSRAAWNPFRCISVGSSSHSVLLNFLSNILLRLTWKILTVSRHQLKKFRLKLLERQVQATLKSTRRKSLSFCTLTPVRFCCFILLSFFYFSSFSYFFVFSSFFFIFLVFCRINSFHGPLATLG